MKTKIYMVVDNERWGFSHTAVRAETEDEAIRIAIGPLGRKTPNVQVLELDPRGQPKVLWCYDECPDSPCEHEEHGP